MTMRRRELKPGGRGSQRTVLSEYYTQVEQQGEVMGREENEENRKESIKRTETKTVKFGQDRVSANTRSVITKKLGTEEKQIFQEKKTKSGKEVPEILASTTIRGKKTEMKLHEKTKVPKVSNRTSTTCVCSNERDNDTGVSTSSQKKREASKQDTSTTKQMIDILNGVVRKGRKETHSESDVSMKETDTNYRKNLTQTKRDNEQQNN